ncbi:hypothetical protein JCM10908_002814 [Rhodotorula pacifica]|uniref:Mim2p n=1 Tax=Rhodotorula pacifica TaxID=1495444 RepID=UPI00316E0BD1
MASPPIQATNITAEDGYLPSNWVVPPSDWPPRQGKASKRPRSRRRIERASSTASDPTASASEAESGDSDCDNDDDDTSSSWSSSSWDSELAAREAQLQWDESMRQLQALLNLVAIPWIARYFGRKWAYSLFDRYLQVGLGKRFWLGPLAMYAHRAWR